MTLSGYAAIFNTETVIAGLFRERIAPGAFREAIERDDVRALFNHNPDVVLGRKSAGTLRLREDAKGLHYTVTINSDDPVAAGLAARVSRRDISGSSFWFGIDNPETDEEWEPAPPRNGLPLRTLKRLSLIDVSPVTFPAYVQASVDSSDGRGAIERVKLRIAIARAWDTDRRAIARIRGL
jgi:HK97 family phage prohead protease